MYNLESYNSILKNLQKELKRANARLVERLEILKQCSEWENLYHQGLLLQSNFHQINEATTELKVTDWKNSNKEVILPLLKNVPLSIQLKKIFHRCKKLQKGIPYAEKQIEIIKEQQLLCASKIEAFEKISTEEELKLFSEKFKINLNPCSLVKKSFVEQKELAKPYTTYKTASNLQILVGKNAKGNDQLTFHYANGLDWWLHAKDYPGSHVVIKGTKGLEPDQEALKDAAELALRFSKAKNISSGEVSLTQVKGLKRVKGILGKVMLSKSITIYIKLDNLRFKTLRERKI